MSDTNKPMTQADDAKAEALNWLAGQFRWESLLRDLHELAERETTPVVALEQPRAEETEQDSAA